MAAYAIVDLEVYDIEAYLAYQQALRPVLDAFGGSYLARGGPFKVFVGDYQPRRLILVEFPSLADIEAFFASPAYQALEAQRQACSDGRMIGVEGL
jgi:uncharacterized protein (DUF1330 family)